MSDLPLHKRLDLKKNAAFAAALAILLVAVATIAGAWIFQLAGYAPCELCLKERLPYYAAIVVAAGTVLLAQSGQKRLLRAAFALLAAILIFSAGFGAYHAGVEWGFWPGPEDCTGAFKKAHSAAEFLRQLQTIQVVRCDAAAIRILGLSLAGWNAVISVALAGLAIFGLRRA